MNSRLLCLLMPMAASFSPWALAASLQLAAPDITVKVRPSSALKASDAPPLQLLALKGETESAQLALWSQQPLQLKVNLSPLLHANGQRFPLKPCNYVWPTLCGLNAPPAAKAPVANGQTP